MKNSLVLFTFFRFDWTYLFRANLVKKVKIVNLGRYLVPRLIWICRIKWWCSLFSVLDRKCFFSSNLVQKIKLPFKLKLGTRISPGDWGDPPDYPKNWLVSSMSLYCFGSKYWFCNFHTVFSHFAQSLSRSWPPIENPGYLNWFQYTEFNGVNFFWFRLEMPYLGKFGLKNENCQFTQKFSI